MNSIRPLFRSNGRLGTPQIHGAFQDWIGDTLRGRHQAPPDARPLIVQLVKHPDGLGDRLVGRPQLKDTSVPAIIASARKRNELRDEDAEFLRKFLIKTISRETYGDWLSTSHMADLFYENDWSNEDNNRKFALYALACFVDFFRPGQIDWRTPNQNDMQLVEKLLKAFLVDSNDADRQKTLLHRQKRLLQGLFDLTESLKGLAVETSTGLSRKDRELLLECRDLGLKAEARARWLQKSGFKGFGKSALTKFGENPNSMRAQISTWTTELLEE
ncbi:MAG TPA: hypothetical protein VN982_06490 [Candidatus Dormibacteraeota bacterium]|nr:hypothetical protein [Candidatus Dormibacteraeota bacterium]